MIRIILLLMLDVALTSAVSTYLYFTRDIDAAFTAGLSIFIAFSPICLVLASPFTTYLAARKLAKLGIKLNNPNALKNLAEVNIVALPYNRVLTGGEYYITDLVPELLSQSNLLTMAASAERDAENLLGHMIYVTAVSRGLRLQKSTSSQEFSGRGVEAVINGTTVRVGNVAWLESIGVSISANLRTKIDQLLVKGKTAVVVATGRVSRGIIALKDDSSDAAKKFLGVLMRSGLETLLLTALPKKMANRISKEFALKHIRTNLTPEAKAREVQIFRAKGNIVAVIGNDSNDLPALVSADVSLMLTGGTIKPEDHADIPLDFELPSLESFIPLRELAINVVDVLKLNKKIALVSWLVLVPPALLTVLEHPPIPFHPIMAVAGVIIFSALILVNSLRTK